MRAIAKIGCTRATVKIGFVRATKSCAIMKFVLLTKSSATVEYEKRKPSLCCANVQTDQAGLGGSVGFASDR